MTSAPASGANRRPPALIVLCFVQFMLVLDDTVVSVALPSIQDDLGFSTAGLAWVVNAYFLAFGGLLLLSGRAADLLGRRRVFLAGVALFGAASLACGLAQEPWQLVAGRFVQGAGAAMASPAALALITLLFPGPDERAKALGVWGGIAGLGGTLGLVISGALTGLASWRWIFLINLPVALFALALLPRLVAESRASHRARIDVPGAVLGTGALISLVYGLLETGESGWGHAASVVPLVLAVVLAVSFLAVETRTAEPLVPLGFLASRIRAVANGTTLLFSAAFYAMAFLLMLHLQTVLHYGPLTAGVAYLPYGGGILAGMWLSSRAVARLGIRLTLVTGFVTSSAGLLLLSGVTAGERLRVRSAARHARHEPRMRTEPARHDDGRTHRHHWGERRPRLGGPELGATSRRRRGVGGAGHPGSTPQQRPGRLRHPAARRDGRLLVGAHRRRSPPYARRRPRGHFAREETARGTHGRGSRNPHRTGIAIVPAQSGERRSPIEAASA